MPWLQLDPDEIAQRARATGAEAPSLVGSAIRGVVGFTFVSLAGFVPWAFFGAWFRAPGHGGELGMYAACALVFLALSGLALHRLIIGPGSLGRFYLLFTPAFTLYAIAWIVGWMTLRGHLGGVVGIFAGTTLMGLLLAWAFGAWKWLPAIVLALFALNCAGYFIGGVVEGWLLQTLPQRQWRVLAMMAWGLFYGIGFGAGLGLAFYLSQTRARRLLAMADHTPSA